MRESLNNRIALRLSPREILERRLPTRDPWEKPRARWLDRQARRRALLTKRFVMGSYRQKEFHKNLMVALFEESPEYRGRLQKAFLRSQRKKV